MARIALVAAIYFALTILPPFSALAFGPVQVRVSEGLMVLPAIMPEAVLGLFLGCFAANLTGGLGPVDIVFGSLATLAAAYLVRRMRCQWLVPVPVIGINALVVGTYLPLLLGLPIPLWVSWGYIAAGEALATVGIGLPLLLLLRGRPHLLRLLGGGRA
jgi:uncharacterized membrane protein